VQAFSIRGASEVAGGGIGNRVLLLIDGRPALSPESGGALWNLVPLNSVERIEVVKGAYSSLYGSSAMGGVINVITHKPEAEPLTRV
ncbi:MAG: TonB-dependent receptor plug domain-containing protein, partial [Saprospiraceae bacterium]|nr:TonB-dependent receptor plug domain-containing protein [Saprospiraceae bacterium]